MQRFSLDRRRFAGHPRRGFPRPPGGSPSPSKSPPEGGDRTPKGRGRAAPLSGLSAAPSTPLGHPYGVPPASPAPPPVRSGSEGGKRSAQGVSPEKGLEKNQSCGADRGRRPPAVEMWGRWGSRWAGVGAAGGQPPGLSTGCPCLCPRTGEAAHRSRSDLHISTARGSNSAPSGGLFCPAGLTTSVQEV